MSAPAQPCASSTIERLRALYHDSSKHSVYQSVPAFVAARLGYQEEIHSLWRSDTPRLDYIQRRLVLASGASLADIGANTGFFSLNLAHARNDVGVTAYELNDHHAEFIRLTAELFALNNLSVSSRSCDFEGLDALGHYDVMLLLNVVHHAGFDFDPHVPDTNEAFTAHACRYLNRCRQHAARLVFQVGSNRGGDKTRPLFHRDDDVGRIRWAADTLAEAGWTIEHLGYAQLDERNAVTFTDVPAAVLDCARQVGCRSAVLHDFFAAAALHRFPGEFHRRPLIIAKATR